MPEIFSTWEMYEWLVKQFHPEDYCPHCGELHPRLILSGTFKRSGHKLFRWKEECKGVEFEVTRRRHE